MILQYFRYEKILDAITRVVTSILFSNELISQIWIRLIFYAKFITIYARVINYLGFIRDFLDFKYNFISA